MQRALRYIVRGTNAFVFEESANTGDRQRFIHRVADFALSPSERPLLVS
jgi:hypothetical protein